MTTMTIQPESGVMKLPRVARRRWIRTVCAALVIGVLVCVPRALRAQSWNVGEAPLYSVNGNHVGDGEIVGRVAGAVFLQDGSLVIADGSRPRLWRYSASGAFEVAAGRDGSGPGEYSTIEWLGRCARDEIFVFDLLTRRFSVLDERLKFRRAFRLDGFPTALTCAPDGQLAFLDAVMAGAEAAGSTWRATARLLRSALPSGALDTLATVPLADMLRVGGSWFLDPGGRRTSLAIVRDGVVAADGSSDPIPILGSDGTVAARYALEPRSIRMSDSVRMHAAEEFLSRVGDDAIRASMLQRIMRVSGARVQVHYRRVFSDEKGLLWVQRSLRGSGSFLAEAVTRTGQVMARVALPVEGELLAVSTGRIAIAEFDSEGVTSIRVHVVR